MIRVSAANSRWSLAVPLALAVSVLGATTRATAQEDCMKTKDKHQPYDVAMKTTHIYFMQHT